MINEKEKQDKIMNFNIIVENQNNNVATEFLSLANWNVSEAVNLYLYSMSDNNSNININNQNSANFKYIAEFSFESSGILDKFSSLFKSSYLKNNEQLCNNFIGKIKCLVKRGESFTNLLKSNKGIIILYNKDTFQKLNQQLNIINNDYPNNYLNSVLIYPIINDSVEGNNLINLLHINRFPCYLFCKYKSNNVFYIIDKMEGIFYLQTFKNTLFPQIIKPNINNINSNISNNQNNNKSQQNSNKNLQNNNKKVENNHIQKENKVNNLINKNSDNNEIPSKEEIKKEIKNNKENDDFPKYINNEFSELNNENIPYQDINNNNFQENNNKNIINNENNSNISEEKNLPKKEYIPDYRDYEFDNDLFPIYPGIEQNQMQIPSFSDNYLNDSGALSDSMIRKNIENEMKRLEKIEEEKEKKIREEKEKKRKEEEEKKKLEQKEKEDKELFSMLIPPEPDDNNPDKCIIIFRLPDGEKNIQRKFLKTDKIAILYDYIRSLGKEIYSEEGCHNFSIIQAFPFKNFENKLNNTLEEEGLFPNSVLQIKENN